MVTLQEDHQTWLTPTRRRIIVWCAVGLAIVLLIASSLTVWVKQQALDTDNWVDVSAQLLQDDDVRAALSTRMVDVLFDQPAIEQRADDLLPPSLDGLVAPAIGLLRQSAITATDDFLATPAAQRLWEEANRRAHQRLVALLEGDDSGLLTATNGDVVLDLAPLVQRIGDRLGLQVALREGAGQITLMRSDQLKAAQDGVQTIQRLSVLMVILVLGLLGVAVYLAEGFRRSVLQVIAIALVVVGLVLLVLRRLVGDAVVDALTEPATRSAGSAVWLIGTGLLRDMAIALVIYGLVLLVGVWFAGTSRPAVAARRRLAPVIRGRTLAVYCVVAVVFLAVLLLTPGLASRRLVGVLVLVALATAGVEVLRRQILGEAPPGPGRPA